MLNVINCALHVRDNLNVVKEFQCCMLINSSRSFESMFISNHRSLYRLLSDVSVKVNILLDPEQPLQDDNPVFILASSNVYRFCDNLYTRGYFTPFKATSHISTVCELYSIFTPRTVKMQGSLMNGVGEVLSSMRRHLATQKNGSSALKLIIEGPHGNFSLMLGSGKTYALQKVRELLAKNGCLIWYVMIYLASLR
jgi:hypothetical protein